MTSPKRKLPVVQPKAGEDAEAERRPPWQWVLIGSGFVLTIWIPLVIIGLWLARGAWSTLVAAVVTFALACTAAGALVGTFGGRAKEREAALAGLVGAFAASGIALLGGATPGLGAASAGLVLGAVGAAFAWLGGRWGVRRRR